MALGARRFGPARPGFFSFQDVITSVIGVIILLVLLLTLYVGEEREDARQTARIDPGTEIELARTRAGISRLQAAVIRLEDEVGRQLSPQQVALVEQQLATVLEEEQRLRAELERDATLAPDQTLEQDLERTRQLLAMALEEQQPLEELNGQLAEAERRQSARALDLADTLNEVLDAPPQLSFLPGTDDDKEPVVVILSGSGASLNRLGQGEVATVRWQGNPAAEWRQLLASFDTSEDYFYFLVRPSASRLFHFAQGEIRQVTSRAGFVIGYDALSEDVVTLFPTADPLMADHSPPAASSPGLPGPGSPATPAAPGSPMADGGIATGDPGDNPEPVATPADSASPANGAAPPGADGSAPPGDHGMDPNGADGESADAEPSAADPGGEQSEATATPEAQTGTGSDGAEPDGESGSTDPASDPEPEAESVAESEESESESGPEPESEDESEPGPVFPWWLIWLFLLLIIVLTTAIVLSSRANR